jgi:hypothetical protein
LAVDLIGKDPIKLWDMESQHTITSLDESDMKQRQDERIGHKDMISPRQVRF